MNRYIEFNAGKFLAESKGWEKEKKKLQEDMDSLAELQRAGAFTGKSGKPGDSTAAAVVERGRIQSEIDRLNLYEEAKTYALNHLSGTHRAVLTTFFFKDGQMGANVRECGKMLAVCVNEVYKLRREALAEVSRIITRRYRL